MLATADHSRECVEARRGASVPRQLQDVGRVGVPFLALQLQSVALVLITWNFAMDRCRDDLVIEHSDLCDVVGVL